MQTRHWPIAVVIHIAVTLCWGGPGSMAFAADNESVIKLAGAASADQLVVDQSEHGGHRSNIHLEDKHALRPGPEWARQSPSLLRPNRILQSGSAHTLTVHLAGTDHQVAVHQFGRTQDASIRSRGRGNGVSITRTGRGNRAAAMQAGERNVVVIRQE